MAENIYGTTVIPSDQVTVLSGGTVSVALGTDSSVGLVGGMDTSNGSATAGETLEITSVTQAENEFGENSELARQASLCFNNGATPLYMTGVPETDVTESISLGSSITLTDPPMDPTVHPDEEIVVTDTDTSTDLTVNIVYDEPTPTPSESGTANVNPITGDIEVDTSGNYDISYTYGDYQSAAIDAVGQTPNKLVVLSERSGNLNDGVSEVTSDTQNFNFSRVVGGIHPFADTDNPDTSGYTDSFDDQRLVVAASPRGYIDDAETEQARTAGAIASHLASRPIGVSATNDSINGFTSLRTELTPTEAGELIDAQVLPIVRVEGAPTIAKDMTTSTDSTFERVYVCDVADELTESSHIVAREYIGEQNTSRKRNNLRRAHRNFLLEAETTTPTLLDDFSLTVSENTANPNQVDVEIGLDAVNVMDTIDVTIRVGDVITFDGQN